MHTIDAGHAPEEPRKRGKIPMKNTPADNAVTDKTYADTGDELRQFIERYEQLNAEKADVSERQKDLMAEAKGRGFDTKVMKMVVALRRRNADDIAEEQAVLDLYLHCLGMAG